MLSRLLYLDENLLRRCVPFFGLYLLLFAALTLADGLSLSLFVQRAGAANLPFYYALSAVGMAISTVAYMVLAGRFRGSRVFGVILGGPAILFFGIYLVLSGEEADPRWLGALFLGREIALALVLLHFGTWLLDFFTRTELNRVMPVIYAGGRFGGIVGGAILEYACHWIALWHLLAVLSFLLGLGMVGVWLITRYVTAVEQDAPQITSSSGTGTESDATAPHNVASFLRFLWCSPLMFWITVSTAALFACRAMLSLQYNAYFETAFTTEAETAQFLGRYTQIALAGSLLVQLLVLNRLVAWLGLKGTQFVYASLFASAAMLTLLPMTLATAVLARLVENELRFCLRNPVSQMIVNQFSKATRLLARAWSLGLLIPLSTFAAASLLAVLLRLELGWAISLLTAALGMGYLLASWGLTRSFDEPEHPGAVRRGSPSPAERGKHSPTQQLQTANS